jgi:hypothetical protein
MKLYQAFFLEQQRPQLSPYAVPYFIDDQIEGGDREYELFKRISIVPNDDEPWGLISWKFRHKTHVHVEEFLQFADQSIKDGFDCAYINPMIGNEAIYLNVWEQGTHSGHKNLDLIIDYFGSLFGPVFKQPMGVNSFAFCNYFVANRYFWDGYFRFIDSCLDLLRLEASKNTEVGNAFCSSAGYVRDHNLSLKPFIIERLFSTYLSFYPQHKVAPFNHKVSVYHSKFGCQIGDMLWRLSALKNAAIKNNDSQSFKSWNDAREKIFNSPLKMLVSNLDDPPSALLEL